MPSHGLVVVLGKSFTGKLAHEASKSTGGLPSDVTRDSTTYRADFQARERPRQLPGAVPDRAPGRVHARAAG